MRLCLRRKTVEHLYSVPKNAHIIITFLNNSVENKPILIIFGVLNPEKT